MEKQIIPAVLENSLQNFEESIKKIENSKINFSHIQIDIMDGKFVPNFSFDQNDEHLNLNINTNLKFELHLMTEHPLKDMIRWQTETNVFRVLFHIESSDDPQECIDFCLDNGWQVGIVINPSTEINKVIPFTEKIDVLMFMTVIPGKQGQKMMPEIEKNIKEYKNLIKNNEYKPLISVDGGINTDNIKTVKNWGVDVLNVGSSLVKTADLKKAYTELLNKLK